MKTRITMATFIVASLCVQLKARSQEIDFKRWEVGIDLLWLINKNVAPPSLFAKRLELKQRKNAVGYIHRGFRARVGCDLSALVNSFPFSTKSLDLLARLGYEWDLRIKSLDVFYGLDLVSRFQDYYSVGTDGMNNLSYDNSIFYLGISPVVGINYSVYKNLKVSIESNIDVLFAHREAEWETGDPDHVFRTDNGILLKANPLYVLNALFTF